MILLQKKQAHSQVYVNGKLLNLEKAPRKQVILFFSLTKNPECEGSILPSSFYG